MIRTLPKTKQIYLIFLAGLLFTACSRNKKVDVSNIPIDVHIERFDHDFDAMRTKPMAQQDAYLKQKYGVFYKDFIALIIPASNISDTAYFKSLRAIFN